MTWWEITLWSIPSALPGWLVWRWRVRRAQARMVAEIVAHHRNMRVGCIKVPGERTVRRIAEDEA